MPQTVRPAAAVGDPIDAIDTPALVVDADALERNVAAMATFARERSLRLRPHAKTHKCAAIARLQIAAGAVGVCVQKTDEAVALAAQGINDILITNEVIAPAKLTRMAMLAQRTRLGVVADSLHGIEQLGRAMHAAGAQIDVFIDIDVGQGRCGATPQEAGALAQAVWSAGGSLRLAGLQAYHGGAQHLRQVAQRASAIAQAGQRLRRALAAMQDAGVPCPLVTGAGSGSFAFETASGLWGELQTGSYVFMDRDYADNEPTPGVPRFEHALFVKSRVISCAAHHAVIDAGHKSHALDSGPPQVWGRAMEWANGGDEHGIVRSSDGAALPTWGDTVWLVPGHCDPTVNLHDHLVLVRGGLEHGRVEAIFEVDARGALR